jgi:hypothetical protein
MSVNSISTHITPPAQASQQPQVQRTSGDNDGDKDSGKESAVSQTAETRTPSPTAALGQKLNITG